MHQSIEEEEDQEHVELVPGPSSHNNNNHDDGNHRSTVPPYTTTPTIMMYVLVVMAATFGYLVGVNNHASIPSANIGGGDVINSSSYATANILNNNTTIITIPDEPPKYIFLLGERNSGTNYLDDVLNTAFYPKYSKMKSATYKFSGCSPDAHPKQTSSCIPVLEFKHMFRHSLLSQTEINELKLHTDGLWILAVRSPCDWADAMLRKPWQLCDPNLSPQKCKGAYIGINKAVVSNMTREYFFSQLPWWENAEARFSNNGEFMYPGGVFQLRAHKLQIMKQLMDIFGPQHRIKIVHLNHYELSPAQLVHNLGREFGLDINKNAEIELKPTQKPHNTNCLTEKEWLAAEAKIDWELEAHFGFTPLDCHMCG